MAGRPLRRARLNSSSIDSYALKKILPGLLYPKPDAPGESRHRALDGVVRMLEALQTRDEKAIRKVFSEAPDVSGVLMDRIMELWPDVQSYKVTDTLTVRVKENSLLHRWIVQDSIYSARSVPQEPVGMVALRATQTWVLLPNEDKRIAAYAASADSAYAAASAADYNAAADAAASAASAAASAASAYAAATFAADAAYAAADYAAYAATHAAFAAFDASAYSVFSTRAFARKRMNLLGQLAARDLLPDITPEAVANPVRVTRPRP